MITRRKVVIRFQTGVAALLAGHFGLRAVTAAKAEPESRIFRENCSFLIDLRTDLARRVERGELSMIAETSARCPLCKETIAITAKDAVAYVTNSAPTVMTTTSGPVSPAW